MRQRVGVEMKKRLDTGVRVNKQLLMWHGAAAASESSEDTDIVDVTTVQPADCVYVTQTRLDDDEALKSRMALVAIVVL